MRVFLRGGEGATTVGGNIFYLDGKIDSHGSH